MRSETDAAKTDDRTETKDPADKQKNNRLKWGTFGGPKSLFFKELEQSITLLAGSLSKEMRKTGKQLEELKKMSNA